MPSTSSFTTRPQLAGTFGMVASTHWLASAAGMAVLEKGGNAFDAAVATGLVLQVVEPHLNGPGGEVPVIGFDAADGEVFVLDGQGPAPAAATLEAFGALGLDLVPGTGLLAACVPAAFGTWMLLLARHGRLRLRDVMEYAIGYAADGYPMLPARERGDHRGRRDLPRALAQFGRGLPARRGRRRARAPGSPTRTWPPPTGGSWTRPRRRRPTARPRSRPRGRRSTRGSWPRPSPASPSGPR